VSQQNRKAFNEMKTFKSFSEEKMSDKQLDESNLSRIYRHLMDHDCAILTAFRSNPFDRTRCAVSSKVEEIGLPENILKTNKLNNRDFKAVLLSTGCGVTAVDGSFIENYNTNRAVEVKEDSLFVVNLKNNSDFFNAIISLGKKYCQDSVLLIPKGCKEVFLHGTNNSQFPGLDARVKVGDWKGGKDAEFMTKIRNRPFVFETYEDLSWKERMAVRAIAKTC